MIKKSGISAGISLVVVMLLCLGSLSASETPAPEQVLAAAVQARDLEKIKLAPGGWWNDAPEFNGRLDTSAGPPLVEVFVMAHVFGLPDKDPSEVATALNLYSDASAAKTAFDKRAGFDKQTYGNLVDGPSVGDQSRYMRRASDSKNSAVAAVRFRYKKYSVRVEATGKAAELSTQELAGLAKVVIGRLDSLEAGQLRPPNLPQVAERLPVADEVAGPIMGTAGLVSDSWAWDSSGSVSPKLRTLGRKGIKEGVTQRYVLAAQPDNVLDLVIIEFRSEQAALLQCNAEYNRKEKQKACETETPTLRKSQFPGVQHSSYDTKFRARRWVVEIVCTNPYKPQPTSACVNASRHMEERVKQNLARS